MLSLFNEAPKKARNWQRPFFVWTFGGVPLPLSDAAMRQNEMLRADTMPGATGVPVASPIEKVGESRPCHPPGDGGGEMGTLDRVLKVRGVLLAHLILATYTPVNNEETP